MKIRIDKKNDNRRIGLILGRYLLVTFLMVFVLALASVIIESVLYSKEYSYKMLEEYVADVICEVNDDIYLMFKEDTHALCELLDSERYDTITDIWLTELVAANSSSFSELNIVNSDGIIEKSSVPENIGFDMKSNEDSAEFLCLLNDIDYFEQGLVTSPYDPSKEMIYAGHAFLDGCGFLQMGVTPDQYDAHIEKQYADVVRHRRIGLIGYIVVLNKDYECIGSTGDEFIGRKLEKIQVLPDNENEYKRAKATFNGEESYWVSARDDKYYVLGAFPVSESNEFGTAFIIMTIFILIVMHVVMFISLRKNLNVLVVEPIAEIDKSLSEITGGNLDEKVHVNTSLEFEELSNGINHTVDRLKEMIEEADKLIAEELVMARKIQNTSLPSIFPPYPTRKDIGLYATMNAAKQVGGDFYDYFMVKENLLAVVIADVADKGIPAALFMMKAKTVLKAYAVSGRTVDKVVSMTNEELAKDNPSMFVTLWIGLINLNTGLVQYVHAGHTYPLVIRGDETLQIKQKRNFVVGGKKGAVFIKQEYQLLPEDILFLYTDGVTEAINKDGEEYEEERLTKCLLEITKTNECDEANELCRQVCTGVREDVRAFSNGAEQFDDITMLCFKYQPDKKG